MYNILFCSAGRRAALLKRIKQSLNARGNVLATEISSTAPALYFADKSYIIPKLRDVNYMSTLLGICERDKIKAITTLIDPEITVLARNRSFFEKRNILLLTPSIKTAKLCFDKYLMFEYLSGNNINTIKTYSDIKKFIFDCKKNIINFPVFIKPRCGSGSVGAKKVHSMDEMKFYYYNESNVIIQEFMDGDDIDVDIYVDCISKEVISIFAKRKLETKIGGANKTISFKDERLFDIIQRINKKFNFYGPVDMDFFYKDNQYYLSEINPRFGGSYIHAHDSGTDYVPFIINNIQGIENTPVLGEYIDDTVMMMYDDIIIRKAEDLA